jgi:hypothetical protein
LALENNDRQEQIMIEGFAAVPTPASQPNHGPERDTRNLKSEARLAISTGGRHQMEVLQ